MYIKKDIDNFIIAQSAYQIEGWELVTETTVLNFRPIIPQPKSEISNMQLRLKLIEINILPTQVDAIIEAMLMPEEKATFHTLWNYANSFERLDSRLIGIATQLGLTTEQKDALFL